MHGVAARRVIPGESGCRVGFSVAPATWCDAMTPVCWDACWDESASKGPAEGGLQRACSSLSSVRQGIRIAIAILGSLQPSNPRRGTSVRPSRCAKPWPRRRQAPHRAAALDHVGLGTRDDRARSLHRRYRGTDLLQRPEETLQSGSNENTNGPDGLSRMFGRACRLRPTGREW